MMAEYQSLKTFCLHSNFHCYESMYTQNLGNVLIESNGLVQLQVTFIVAFELVKVKMKCFGIKLFVLILCFKKAESGKCNVHYNIRL